MLGEKFTSNRTYLSINQQGYFFEGSKEDRPGFTEYVKKDGYVVYRREYSYIEGFLTGAVIADSQFGRRVKLTFSDDKSDEEVVLEFPFITQSGYLDGYADRLAHIIENIPTDKAIRITCNRTEKNKDGVYLKKFFFFKLRDMEGPESHIKYARTKDKDPFPQFEKVIKFGKEEYDSRKHDDAVFFIIDKEFKRINENSMKKTGAYTPPTEKSAERSTEKSSYDSGSDKSTKSENTEPIDLPENDDLPF